MGRVHKSPDAIRWAVMGTGYMAHTFASAIDDSPVDRVAAVISRSQAKGLAFGRQFHASDVYSYDRLPSPEDIDIVYIATPAQCHADNIRACLEAGLNVLCEKPLVPTLAEFEELHSMARSRGPLLLEGMWTRCLPTMEQASEWIEQGSIGDILTIRANLHKRVETAPKSVMEDYGEYPLAFVLYFLPEARLENAVRICTDGRDSDWCITLRQGSVPAVINISSRFASASGAAVIGSRGSIEWDSQFNRTGRVCLYDADGHRVQERAFRYSHEGFEHQLREVHKCLENGKLSSEKLSSEASRSCIALIEKLQNPS